MDAVAQVREKIDIVALISEFLPLKKLGRNFKTTCPFHSEKTPSFVVSPERQIWHCFGCNKGGDCFTFLMEYENLEFPEALRTLAKKAGVILPEGKFAAGVSSQKEKIYTVNKEAMEFYHYVLTKHAAGKKALAYLTEERKIKDKVIQTFMLGFAPTAGDGLLNYLMHKKNHTREDLIFAGLATQTGDFFTNRIIFPLFDHRGNIEGFSGRTMSQNFQGSKYVNTRETLVYHKGSVFFGLHIAKEEIKKQNWAIIMEGEFDVISSFQEGIGNAVAVKGTALTENQVNLIARFAQKVSLCFDSDRAGQEAIKRSLPALEKKGLSTSIIVTSDGKDPDEAIRNDPFAFKKAVKNDVGVYDYLLEQTLVSVNKESAEGKKKITEELLPVLGAIENEIVKEHYLKKLAVSLDASYESMLRQSEKMQKKEITDTLVPKVKDKKPRQEILEEYLLALILQYTHPKKMFSDASENLSEFVFATPAHGKIFDSLIAYFAATDVFNQVKFLSVLAPELFAAFDRCYLLPLPIFASDEKYKEEMIKVTSHLQSFFIRSKIKTLGDTIHEKEKNGGNEELLQLREEFSRLASLLPR